MRHLLIFETSNSGNDSINIVGQSMNIFTPKGFPVAWVMGWINNYTNIIGNYLNMDRYMPDQMTRISYNNRLYQINRDNSMHGHEPKIIKLWNTWIGNQFKSDRSIRIVLEISYINDLKVFFLTNIFRIIICD